MRVGAVVHRLVEKLAASLVHGVRKLLSNMVDEPLDALLGNE